MAKPKWTPVFSHKAAGTAVRATGGGPYVFIKGEWVLGEIARSIYMVEEELGRAAQAFAIEMMDEFYAEIGEVGSEKLIVELEPLGYGEYTFIVYPRGEPEERVSDTVYIEDEGLPRFRQISYRPSLDDYVFREAEQVVETVVEVMEPVAVLYGETITLQTLLANGVKVDWKGNVHAPKGLREWGGRKIRPGQFMGRATGGY